MSTINTERDAMTVTTASDWQFTVPLPGFTPETASALLAEARPYALEAAAKNGIDGIDEGVWLPEDYELVDATGHVIYSSQPDFRLARFTGR